MPFRLEAHRSVLLALSLLSACAAAGVDGTGSLAADSAAPARPAQHTTETASGLFLAARLAGQSADLPSAASLFLRALALDPESRTLQEQAFLSCLLTGRPEAEQLARAQPDNAVAQLLVAGLDAQRGHWAQAEAEFAALPQQGVTQALQPMLAAWAQFGGGHPEAALATLRPYVAGPRYRGIYALHAALIADLAERGPEAARLYHAAQTEFGTPNLALARAVASFEARQQDPAGLAEAKRTLAALGDLSPELQMALPALQAQVANRPVATALDGVAEVYLALAAALRAQDASEYATLLLRLALDLRPNFTGARLLASEILTETHHPDQALAVLAPIAADDPLAGLIDQRRADLLDQLGREPEALALLTRLEQAYPDRPEPWRLQGNMLRSTDHFNDAVAAFDQAVKRTPTPGPNDWPLFFQRGVALERARRWPAAEADLQHALALQPDQASVLNYLGYSWADKGMNLPRARQMIERAAAQRPNDGAIVDSLGWVALRQGDVAGAVKQLEHASELTPEDSEMNGHLGDAYRAAGRKLEAYFQWQRALTLKPEPDAVPALQAKVRTVLGELTANTATATP